ncbi:SDR family oxidoreductase [Solirubrobacter ginsenosidimutans]|uniref:SDR family oxidoreductase n=1 Tax=Solirubrobacter ginsenosidimutans TaxID=490573 RepID=A0A9X3MUF5_9ACTN|nr:SDR family oxidoreductase [Solirubrobacter ginsenosidimutans]MDA0162819.1 SDR family oxidoreductase [Solirubrobacter ginsenosidimutans]
MTGSLQGRHALVTGAGRGLGRACALALAREGAEVTVVARTASDLASAVEEAQGGLHGAVADVTDPAAVQRVIAEADARAPLDILVASAGTNRPGPTVDAALEDFDAVMDLNVRATFVAAQAFGRLLLDAARPGRLVLMSSQMGSVGYPGRAVYCASKHAVNGLTKALAVEWAAAGITVNAVAPTFVRTPLTEPMFAEPGFREDVLRRIPAGRIGEPEDVAAAVLYLVSDGAAMVTGHILAVDGGWVAW